MAFASSGSARVVVHQRHCNGMQDPKRIEPAFTTGTYEGLRDACKTKEIFDSQDISDLAKLSIVGPRGEGC
jgi:hypothetical protein